jgi:hypothetical protein
MFEALSTWRSRLFGAPTAQHSEPAAAKNQEWASLDLDPELATFGAKVSSGAVGEAVAPAIAGESEATGAATALETTPSDAAQTIESALDRFRLLDGGETLDGCDDDGVVELDFSGAAPTAPSHSELVPPTAAAAPEAASAAPDAASPLKVVKPKRTPARKGAGKVTAETGASPKAPQAAKKPARRSGLGLHGGWKLPGVDGYMPVVINEDVENVRLELLLPSTED